MHMGHAHAHACGYDMSTQGNALRTDIHGLRAVHCTLERGEHGMRAEMQYSMRAEMLPQEVAEAAADILRH